MGSGDFAGASGANRIASLIGGPLVETVSAAKSGMTERCVLISVRVTPRELAVVEALVRRQRCSRSQAVRWLAFFGAPQSIPELNQQAFAELYEIRAHLVDLELEEKGQPQFILEALEKVERALDRMRSSLLPSP